MCVVRVIINKKQMEKVICNQTNKEVYVVHQGFDIAIIKRDIDSPQECVNINTLNVSKRSRPKRFKYE